MEIHMSLRTRAAALTLIVATTTGLSACGALFNGGPANVAVNSNPSGAEVWIDGTNRGVTPATLSLAKNKSHTLTFRKAGFQETTFQLNRKVSGGYVILDILGGLIPIIVDAATGSWYVLDTNTVNVNLQGSQSAQGQLTTEQLAAVRAGTPVSHFISLEDVAGK
jgi:hypothetical protein